MKRILFFVLLVSSIKTSACDCPPITPINNELIRKYDVIFFGKVDSVSLCDTKGIAVAYFTIEELYKRNIKQQVAVHFDCSTSCLMSFAKGEEWLIYGFYKRFGVVSVNLCGHSRKYISATEQDFYSSAANRTFNEEKQFLKTNLGLQSFIQDENWNQEQKDLKPTNEQPSNSGKIWLLVVSFVAMIIIYILTRKKKKENG